jgi:hypothetical protein
MFLICVKKYSIIFGQSQSNEQTFHYAIIGDKNEMKFILIWCGLSIINFHYLWILRGGGLLLTIQTFLKKERFDSASEAGVECRRIVDYDSAKALNAGTRLKGETV